MLWWAFIKVYRCCFRIRRWFAEDSLYVKPPKVPWLWVGAVLESDEIVTVTEEINASLKYGDRVDAEYLDDIIRHPGVKEWKYLSVETLEELQFPSEGFLIEEDDKSD